MATVDHALTGYQLTGTSPGGIFLHGFRSNCDGEKAVALARHAESRGKSWFRFNQRFCGSDNVHFAHFTVSTAVEDTVKVLDWVRQPIVLIGSSLGAIIALRAGCRRPGQVRGLLLLAPAFRFAQRHFLSLPKHEIDEWRCTGTRQIPDHFEGGSFSLDYGFYQDLLDHPDQGPWKLDCPVTILHGEQDELLPPQDSFELKEMICAPTVSLEVIPGGDHRLNGSIPLMCKELDKLW